MTSSAVQESNHENDGDEDSMPDTASVCSAFHREGSPYFGPVDYIGHPRPLLKWEELDNLLASPPRFSTRVLILPFISCGFCRYPVGDPCGVRYELNEKDASEGNKTCIWGFGPEEQLPAFSIVSGKILCTVYFDPAGDRLIITNTSLERIYCKRTHTGTTVDIPPNETGVVTPGEWELSTNIDECQMRCKVLDRRCLIIRKELGSKRGAEDEDERISTKRTYGRAGTTLHRSVDTRGPLPTNPLLDMVRGETIHLGIGNSSGTIKRLEPIYDRQLASSYKAEHSKIPGKFVVVKVIRPSSRRRESTVDAIETWIREITIHSNLGAHYAIVPYLGSDARFGAIITEHIDAKPLVYHVKDEIFREFNGDIIRTWRILGDMASALSFLHARNIVHCDIQLLNILFHPVRGAILTSFGLSFEEGQKPLGNSLPWYLPPEFLEPGDPPSKATDMWALGVVMMWVLGKIPQPETTKGWTAKDVRFISTKAPVRMEEWLSKVQAGNDELQIEVGISKLGNVSHEQEIAGIVWGLLNQDKDDRLDAESLVERLAKFNLNE
ncbi:kinase-like domain-containing protein [Xylaria arbuscula]|nr:kinase-like domain-containing protein [Xylaria arbuscula]